MLTCLDISKQKAFSESEMAENQEGHTSCPLDTRFALLIAMAHRPLQILSSWEWLPLIINSNES